MIIWDDPTILRFSRFFRKQTVTYGGKYVRIRDFKSLVNGLVEYYTVVES